MPADVKVEALRDNHLIGAAHAGRLRRTGLGDVRYVPAASPSADGPLHRGETYTV